MYKPYIFDPRIGVNEDGTLYNYKTGKVLKQHKTKNGYLNVVITSPGMKHKAYRVHRVYAIMHVVRPPSLIDVPFDQLEVNHIDGDKTNNNPTNLEWVTGSGNCIHAVSTDLTSVNRHIQVKNMVTGQVTEFKSIRRASRQFNIPLPTLAKHLRSNRAGMYRYADHAFRYMSTDNWPCVSSRNRSWFITIAVNKHTNTSYTFDTLSELARFTGAKYTTVNKALITKSKSVWQNEDWIIRLA